MLASTSCLRSDRLTALPPVQGVAYIEDVGQLYTGPLLGDRGRLRQVIANVVSNAAKFTDAGSVTFRVRQVVETPNAVRLQFTILDTGCGIPAAVLPTLFQPFRQADSSTARRYGGTGLGLTISRELITLMGGTVDLSSEEGQGTAMVITTLLHKNLHAVTGPDAHSGSGMRTGTALEPDPHMIVNPRAGTNTAGAKVDASRSDHSSTDVHQAAQSSSLDSGRSLERSPESVNILVAEDNELLRSLLVKMLTQLKFTVVAVEDGALAIKKVHEGKVDLILMDGQMPNKDGYQATREIRSDPDPTIASVPIIALTASAFSGDRERCLEAGMSHYLSKPVRTHELKQAIWNQLDGRGNRNTFQKDA